LEGQIIQGRVISYHLLADSILKHAEISKGVTFMKVQEKNTGTEAGFIISTSYCSITNTKNVIKCSILM